MSLTALRGMPDLFPEDKALHNHIITQARHVAGLYGFQEMATPLLEPLNLFQRSVGATSDIVSKEMYTLEDRNGQPICLRPEGTASIIRAVLNAKKTQEAGQKYFYQGPMFRYERPQKGRLRQFHQIGVEHINESSPWADAEIIALAHHILKALGLQNIQLEVNSLGDEETRLKHREALVAYYTRHQNNLSEDSQRRLALNPLRILDSKDPNDQEINQDAPSLHDFMSADVRAFFDTVCQELEALNIPYTINPCLVRGLDYYCHTTFEFKSDDLGAQSTVLAGGRYDKLSSMLGGPSLPSIGWAAGIERLALLCQNAASMAPEVSVIPVGEEVRGQALQLTQALRAAAISAVCAYSSSMKNGLKRADKFGITHVILVGSDEVKEGRYTVKNLLTSTQDKSTLEEIITLLSQKKA